MRYLKYKLDKPLPIKIRLKVYREALQFITDNPSVIEGTYIMNEVRKTKGFGLCILLPSILWNLTKWNTLIKEHGHMWIWHNTPTAFIELTPNRIARITAIYSRDYMRKIILEEMIAECESKVKEDENN